MKVGQENLGDNLDHSERVKKHYNAFSNFKTVTLFAVVGSLLKENYAVQVNEAIVKVYHKANVNPRHEVTIVMLLVQI